MQKMDQTVRKETVYIATWVLILSALMEAVFLIIGRWDYTVLLGNLLGGGVAVLNFLLMGMTVQRALGKEEKDAKQALRASMTMRTLMFFVAVAVGVLLPIFSTWTLIIPLFFPRLAIAIRPLFEKKQQGSGAVMTGDKEGEEDVDEE